MRCLLSLLAGAILLVGSEAAVAAEPRLSVFVSILPQVEFVERVGGRRVDVRALVLPGQNPATYSPTPKQLFELSRADVYFRIGVPFENALIPRIRSAMKDLRVVDTRKGIRQREMLGHGRRHENEEADGHEAGLDPHIWLDPMLVKQQVQTMRDALSELNPDGAAEYEVNCRAYCDELDRAHERVGRALAPLRGREFFVFHPAYGYFADAYGLKQVAVEAEGKEPGPRQLTALVAAAKERGVKVIFVQPQFDKRNALAIAEAIGGVAVDLDPLAGDYIRNLEEMAAKIERALQTDASK